MLTSATQHALPQPPISRLSQSGILVRRFKLSLNRRTRPYVRIQQQRQLHNRYGTAVHLSWLARRGGPITLLVPLSRPLPVFLLSPPRRRCNPAVTYGEKIFSACTIRQTSVKGTCGKRISRTYLDWNVFLKQLVPQ
jgi:hypothetical protein